MHEYELFILKPNLASHAQKQSESHTTKTILASMHISTDYAHKLATTTFMAENLSYRRNI